jgi:hypothetical protein
MYNTEQTNYSVWFIKKDGKTYALFYDPVGNLVTKREIPHQDINDAIRLNGEHN